MENEKAIAEEVIKRLEAKYSKEFETLQKLLKIPNLLAALCNI